MSNMKARVKATGEIIEVKSKVINSVITREYLLKYVDQETGVSYFEKELFFPKDLVDDLDYWTRLEHKAAIAAMQGMMNNSYLAGEFRKDPNNGIEDMSKIITKAAAVYAHALVEKYKKEEK